MAEESIKILIRQRGIIKRSVTRIKTFIDKFNSEQGIVAITSRRESLEELKQKYEDIQSQLEISEEGQTYEADRELFEDTYHQIKVDIDRIITQHEITNLSRHSSQTNLSRRSSQGDISVRNNYKGAHIKLPTITLKPFGGEYENWRGFHDSFVSMIHNNQDLHDIQKFHYLISSLRNEPLSIAQSLPLSAENYSIVWQRLIDRFQNNKLISSIHIKRLLEQDSIQKENANSLREAINTSQANVKALQALQLDVSIENLLLSQLLINKLDPATRKAWEIHTSGSELESLEALWTFLEKRCLALEAIKPGTQVQGLQQIKQSSRITSKHQVSNVHASVDYQCVLCKGSHNLYKCDSFIKLNVHERHNVVREYKLCFNCLGNNHNVDQCQSGTCKMCGKYHNSLLHDNTRRDRNTSVLRSRQTEREHRERQAAANLTARSTDVTHCAVKETNLSTVLISTAIVKVKDVHGNMHEARCLLDSGSQTNFVSEELAQLLRLRKQRHVTPVTGINGAEVQTSHCITVHLQSAVSSFNIDATCLVLPKITNNLPSRKIDISRWNLPTNIKYADRNFHMPGKIDMLLCADIFFKVITEGKKTRDGYPTLQNTKLGWVVAGQAPIQQHQRENATSLFIQVDQLDTQLKRFWEIEELNMPPVTKEERDCEEHFTKNTTRDATGRFRVRLPLKQTSSQLGNSYPQAVVRFYAIEKKLNRDPKLREEYSAFMNEYLKLGHMKPVPTCTEDGGYFMPHHAVFKPTSTSTKTRVVFDASAKTDSGVSLNDKLLVGPTIQDDLHSIVLRFRSHKIALVADITKMYRQIQVDNEDMKLQRILWRNTSTEPLQCYELTTVTYGTASAPFLAVRCLKQLADEDSKEFLQAAGVLRKDFYVDDLLTGANTESEAIRLQQELDTLLLRGGFELKKWCSNSSKVMSKIPEENRETKSTLQLDSADTVRTLGILWHPSTDQFQFNITVKRISHVTKRNVLSTIAAIFDPLGLLGPVILSCKVFMQQLWTFQLEWDQELPSQLLNTWNAIYSQLPELNDIKIDRYILSENKVVNCELHGFCDASERAYGACVYIRTTDEQGLVSCNLMCSKSRVAPLKQLSIPRLELCGALLLARLLKRTFTSLNLDISSIHAWTDSTIVLQWISSPSARWKTFVANRVSEIQDTAETCTWHHVSTQENPADILSRGSEPQALKLHELWWHGPSWLCQPEELWPITTAECTSEALEAKPITCAINSCDNEDITTRFSSLLRIKRVLAYCKRFIYNLQHPHTKITGSLSTEECNNALLCCVRYIQHQEFQKEIQDLQLKNEVDKRSQLKSLAPFLDKDKCLRVGGRLRNADAAYDQKHQFMLPAHHHVTKLIIRDEHLRLLHASTQLLVASLRMKYWIPHARTTVKGVIRKCVTCYRFKADSSSQLMGQLPADRVKPTRPFLYSGVDFAGPFFIKQGSPRSNTRVKCYVALFVCLATKAIHLELVSNLTTEAFIAALRRMIARRGKVLQLHSDNGSSFIGARNQLRELHELFQSEQHQQKIDTVGIQEGFSWKFIPPRAPNFGGLWEAGVKSMKFHLTRVTKHAHLTFEEMTTLLCQIESILNSRPITLLNNDPNDTSYLTPGHFLIGEPMMAIPEPDLTLSTTSRLSRWNHLQKMKGHFWNRWSSDYLGSLQQRMKWKSAQPSVSTGTVVLIKDDNIPPLDWKLGIIDQTFPGKNGLVRVVDVRTSSGVYRRPVSKVCPLPID